MTPGTPTSADAAQSLTRQGLETTTMNSDVPKKLNQLPGSLEEQYAEPLSKDDSASVQLKDPLLNRILHAAFSMPRELERRSRARAEERARRIREDVPELRGRSDVEVLQIEREAWRAYAAELELLGSAHRRSGP